MKKLMILTMALCLAVVAVAQRPVTTRPQVSNQNNTAMTVNRNNNICTVQTKTYSYAISEMSIPNVTVMDNATTVKQEGRTDKVKVTVQQVSGISYYLYDANDQAISKNYINGGNGYVDMSNYQPGEYRLQLIEPKGAERNFKIIKKQK